MSANYNNLHDQIDKLRIRHARLEEKILHSKKIAISASLVACIVLLFSGLFNHNKTDHFTLENSHQRVVFALTSNGSLCITSQLAVLENTFIGAVKTWRKDKVILESPQGLTIMPSLSANTIHFIHLYGHE